jgi:hypothetical protein
MASAVLKRDEHVAYLRKSLAGAYTRSHFRSA